ncbi:hypothetical protein M080_6387, partial [Bacteroides fragilis str. 3397 T10]
MTNAERSISMSLNVDERKTRITREFSAGTEYWA